MLPLEGITVIALEQAVAVPFATRQLADLGARVIKVERPEVGDFARNYDTTVQGLSSHFVWTNRSKESITIDMKSTKGKQVLKQLIAKADVLIQNLKPGALERMGFIPENLLEKYPELIICNLSGYGKTGPYADKKAYDLLVQCEAGLVSITGDNNTPSKTGISIGDIAGGMYAYTGILTALLTRQKTGEGTILEISLLEALGEWMGYPAYYASYGGEEPARTGASHSTIYPYGPFECGDGKTIFIGLQNEREWKQFCEEVLKQPDLARDSRFNTNFNRSANRHILKKIIEEKLNSLTSDLAIARIEKANIANARLNTMKDFFEHPQLKARNRWTQVDTPKGKINALKPPVTNKNFEAVMDPVPDIGEHTTKILKELGID